MPTIRSQIMDATVALLNEPAGRPAGLPTVERAALSPARGEPGLRRILVRGREDEARRVDHGMRGGPSDHGFELAVECVAAGGSSLPADLAVDPLIAWCIRQLDDSTLGGLAHGIRELRTVYRYEQGDYPLCRAITTFLVRHLEMKEPPEAPPPPGTVLSRRPKGTAFAFYDAEPGNSITLPNVAVAAGSSLVVLAITHDAFGSSIGCRWGGPVGLDLNRDVDLQAAGFRIGIFSLHGLAGAIEDVLLLMQNSIQGHGMAMAVLELDAGGQALVLDRVASAVGSGTAPSSGAAAATTSPDEILIGAIGALLVSSQGGTWQGGFAAGQEVLDHGELALHEGYRIVSAPGAYAAEKTGILSAPWGAALATYAVAP